jgi:hypothetical protein
MHTRLLLALIGALLVVRLPSLVPMGPDQGLYAYVGERILHGELAYRDAWDQKPPGVHCVDAALRSVSTRDIIGPAADLMAQCETFIGLAVAAGIVCVLGAKGAKGAGATGAGDSKGALLLVAAGLLLGAAFALKDNAGLDVLVLLLALAVTSGVRLLDVCLIAAGALAIPLALLVVFWRGGALNDLYQATIAYNLLYSGETYASRWDMARYLVSFPIQHARVDALWFVGGLGCLVLVIAGIRAGVRRRAAWLPVAWVGIACLSIAINGSRNLPQYFLQAAPALALAGHEVPIIDGFDAWERNDR